MSGGASIDLRPLLWLTALFGAGYVLSIVLAWVFMPWWFGLTVTLPLAVLGAVVVAGSIEEWLDRRDLRRKS